MVWIILCLLTALPSTPAVMVDVKGSLSLGRDVVEVLKEFVDGTRLTGRRMLDPGENIRENDVVTLIVHSAFLCRDLEFCKGDLGSFLNDYIIALTKSIDDILVSHINDVDTLNQNHLTLKAVVFEAQLKLLLRFIKIKLADINQKIDEVNENFIWIDLLKRINAKFLDTAMDFAAQKINVNTEDVSKVWEKVTHKLVVATTYVELQFINRLCAIYKICDERFEVTTALNTLLLKLLSLPDDKAKEFIRYFYENLVDTNFYSAIKDTTAHEFQTILHDMAYGNNIPVKKVLGLVQNIVEASLNVSMDSRSYNLAPDSGRDVILVSVILSDMDHFYRKHKKEPFYDFLKEFFDWIEVEGKFGPQMRRVMKDIENSLVVKPKDLLYKLLIQVRVFMEITVDPYI